MSLTFGIDFDNTFTACPELFASFITQAESAGHRIVIVTSRRNTDENLSDVRAFLKEHGCCQPIVFASLGSKLHAVAEREIKVDIWIDDNPETLVHGY